MISLDGLLLWTFSCFSKEGLFDEEEYLHILLLGIKTFEIIQVKV